MKPQDLAQTFKRVIDRIDNAAALPDDPPARRLGKAVLIFLGAVAIACGPGCAWYLARIGLSRGAVIVLGYSVACALLLVHLLVTKQDALSKWVQLVALMLVPFSVQWTAGGFAASGAAVLWSVLSPLCALVFLGPRGAIPWFIAFALLVLFSETQDFLVGRTPGLAPLFAANVLIVSCISFFTMRYFISERQKAQAALEEEHRLLLKEQERSERLLLNILPAPVADRLKAGHGTIADGFAEATVLFADIVGFTQLSARTSPERLVEILNQLFSRFDRVAERHGVEKIKTIGDAYMVCAGLPFPRADHAAAIAEMALGMRNAVAEHNREFGTTLKIRIGINSGPVVAGVIGLKKFIYDLWGDTVNLASRMESHGVPDGIQVTAVTRDLLKDQYIFEDRGPVEIKGKGSMLTYLLKGKKAGNA